MDQSLGSPISSAPAAPLPPGSFSAVARLRKLTVGLLVLVTLVLLAGITRHLSVERRVEIDTALTRARTIVASGQERTARTVGETYRALEGLGDVYLAQVEAGRFNERELHELMAARLAQMPFIYTFVITDPQGYPIASARMFPAHRARNILTVSPIQTGDGGDGPLVYPLHDGIPSASRVMTLPIAIKLHDKNNADAGFLIAVIQPEAFAAFFKNVDVGAQGTVGVWTSEGQLIAASGNEPVRIGDIAPNMKTAIALIAPGTGEHAPAVRLLENSGAQGIVGAGYAEALPIAVYVKLNSADYLAMWRRERSYLEAAVIVILSVMAAFAAIILRQLSLTQRSQEALGQAKAVAEEANEAKSRFLAHMSHEFRTPLNAIMGFADIIRGRSMGEPVAPVYVNYAGDIHRSGEHLLNIVNDILDMAKIESGAQSVQVRAVDMATVISRSLAFVEPLARQSHVTFQVEIANRLPHVSSDEQFARQVLINLLSNAVKFSEPGSAVVVRARVSHRHGLDVTVRDKGPGIEPVILHRIGEPFLQANPTLSRVGQGTGLGLSICKHYMTLLGGELLLESALGSGTTAIMRFPRSLLIQNAAAM